jgi:hypothetical protein
LKEESFETLASPDVVSWFRIDILEDFPILGLPTPPPIKIDVTKEEETPFPLDPIPSSSKTQPLPLKTKTSPSQLPLSPKIKFIVVLVKTPSPLCSLTVHNPMAGANIPRNMMDAKQG